MASLYMRAMPDGHSASRLSAYGQAIALFDLLPISARWQCTYLVSALTTVFESIWLR